MVNGRSQRRVRRRPVADQLVPGREGIWTGQPSGAVVAPERSPTGPSF